MYIKKECVAMLLAGGQGSRLYALTQDMAKPAVPYGGKYRIIDFPLSNCTNSGIDTVGVLTQYQPLVLNDYIGNGQPWDLDKLHGGVHVLPPYQTNAGASWYEGTANAIYQNMSFIERYDPEYVIVLGGDHIYRMDYSKMLQFHKQNQADCTIAVQEVSLEEATRLGIMTCDKEGRVVEFAEKPKELFHSDRGVQYAATAYREELEKLGFIQSMFRKGEPHDNAVAENFFSCLKCELVYLRSYATRSQAQNSIFRYIEGFYNPIRPHSSIGWMSPMAYEQKLKDQNAA